MEMRHSQGGFTFLEVMVAVAIIAIAFVTLIGSQSQSVSVATDSRFYVTATLLAQEKLAELESADFDELFSEEGDFGEDFPRYSWKSEVNILTEGDTGIEEMGDILKSVDLTVRLGDSERMAYNIRTVVVQKGGK